MGLAGGADVTGHQRVTAGAGRAGAVFLRGWGLAVLAPVACSSHYLAGDGYGIAALPSAALYELSPRPRAGGQPHQLPLAALHHSVHPAIVARPSPPCPSPAGWRLWSGGFHAGDGQWRAATAAGLSAGIPVGARCSCRLGGLFGAITPSAASPCRGHCGSLPARWFAGSAARPSAGGAPATRADPHQ